EEGAFLPLVGPTGRRDRMTKNPAEAKRALRRVLIVSKKTAYQMEVLDCQGEQQAKLLAEGNPAIARLEQAHRDHLASLAVIVERVRERGIESLSVDRTELPADMSQFDLVISVGGDGTFLGCSHVIADLPVLGVNSAVGSSHGHWCLANKDNFRQILDQIRAGSPSPLAL